MTIFENRGKFSRGFFLLKPERNESAVNHLVEEDKLSLAQKIVP